MRTLRPFFYFYGSKWTAAPVYPAPRFSRIVEPFAGSAGYSGLYPDRDVVLVERDPIIAELWRWLIKATEAEILALPLEIPTTVRDLGLAPAPAALLGFWVTSGSAAPCQTPNARMRAGKRPNGYWGVTARARVASQVSAIKFTGHAALGDWCRTRPGQVIACENDGATWLPFRHFRDILANNHPGGKANKSAEAIWLSDEQGCEDWDAVLEREVAA